MKAVIQRVESAIVTVEGRETGSCKNGFLVLVGAAQGDTAEDALITIDNNQGHPRGTAAVKNMIGITIDNIRGKLRFSDRLRRMDGGQ